MKFFLLFFIVIPHLIVAQPPIIEWQKSIGGSFREFPEKIISTTDGGYAITGYSESNNFDVPFNAGSYDIYIIKIDKWGNLQWKSSIGGSGEDNSYGIVETNSGYFISGNTIGDNSFVPNYGHTDILLVKLNLDGSLAWKKNFGGSSNDFCRDLIKTNDGNLMMAGYSESNNNDVSGNNGLMDGWVLKLNNNGNIIWQKTFGGINHDYINSIQQTFDNGYILAGSTMSDLSGNYGLNDSYVIKINEIGNIEWQNHFGGSSNDKFLSIIQLRDGSYIAVGDTYSSDFDATENHGNGESRDGFVVKITANGIKEWSKCFGGSLEDDTRCIIQTSDNEYVILAQTHSFDGDITFMNGAADFWLLKLNLDGTIKWQKTFGGLGHEISNCLLQTPDNGFIMIGSTYSLNSGDITYNHGDDDIWVAKLIAQENCYPILNLDKTIYQENATFQSNTILNSHSKIINSSSNIQYKAQQSIILTNGFEVKQGNTFRAEIGNCNN